jgi:hypothetical protein
MKMVFSKQEVAEALGLTCEEFDGQLTHLETCGFPRPIFGLGERWSMIHVVSWINREPETVSPRFAFEESGASGTVVPLRPRQPDRTN